VNKACGRPSRLGVEGTSKWFISVLLIFSGLVLAEEHRMNENDLGLPIGEPEIVAEGENWFAVKCSACHGGGGRGGKAPCLTCGKFQHSGNTNMEIYTTIAAGLPQGRGGKMGAFGTSMSGEAILSVVTYLRAEELRRVASGEIELTITEEPVEFPVVN